MGPFSAEVILTGTQAAENDPEPDVGHPEDDYASLESTITYSQSSTRGYHTKDDTSTESINAGRANDDVSTRPIKNDSPLSSIDSDVHSESQHLLKQIHQTLKDSTIAQESGSDDKSRFWAAYKRQAEEYDSEFFDKYKDDMDIVLIFAGLFSAVCTSFITAMQSNLSPDPTDTTNALLMQVVRALNDTAFAGQNLSPPAWDGPDPTTIWVQSLIYASLSASLLAALGAMLGKQWLGQYRQKGLGMNDDRGRRRQKKLDGAQVWHFHVVLEALPVLLQISLLLFSVALSAYVWTQQSTIGAVVISTTSLGTLFYILITANSMISPNCPFQTPLSIVLPMLWQRGHYIGRSTLIATANSMLRTQLGQELNAILVAWLDARQEPRYLGISKAYHRANSWFNDHWRKACRGRARFSADPESVSRSVSISPPDGPLKLNIPPHRSVQDAPSVKWLLETSTDPDVITVAARIVPEVEWPAALDPSAAVAQLRDIFKGCFIYKTDLKAWQLAPFNRERALACGKALVYLDCDKSYLSTDPRSIGRHVFPFRSWESSQLTEMFQSLRPENRECESVWQIFLLQQGIAGNLLRYYLTPRGLLSGFHGRWLFHLLPHLLSSPWCPDDMKPLAAKEIAEQLLPTNLPSPNVLADCLLSALILAGVQVDREVFAKVDKSSVTELLLGLLLQHLPTVRGVDQDEYRHPVRYFFQPLALLLESGKIRPKLGPCESGQCCCKVIGWSLRMCISLVGKAQALGRMIDEQELQELWSDARAALHFSAVTSCHGLEDCSRWHPSYGGHCGRPVIDGPAWAIDFLKEHYRAQDDVAVADTFFILSQTRDISSWAKSPDFIQAIIHAMQPDKSAQVRHVALHAAWEIRRALATPDDAIISLLPALSAALLSAVVSGDEEHDLQYLQIMYTCVRNEVGTWDVLFRSEGHLQKCLGMAAQHATWSMVSVYLIALAEIFQSRGAEGSFLHDFDPAPRASHLISAWDIVDRKLQRDVLQLEEVEETLPSLIAFTRRFPETDPSSLCYTRDVQSALGKLRQRRPDSLRIGEMEDLVTWLCNRRKSGP